MPWPSLVQKEKSAGDNLGCGVAILAISEAYCTPGASSAAESGGVSVITFQGQRPRKGNLWFDARRNSAPPRKVCLSLLPTSFPETSRFRRGRRRPPPGSDQDSSPKCRPRLKPECSPSARLPAAAPAPRAPLTG